MFGFVDDPETHDLPLSFFSRHRFAAAPRVWLLKLPLILVH